MSEEAHSLRTTLCGSSMHSASLRMRAAESGRCPNREPSAPASGSDLVSVRGRLGRQIWLAVALAPLVRRTYHKESEKILRSVSQEHLQVTPNLAVFWPRLPVVADD